MKKKWRIIGLATMAIAGGLAAAIPALQPPQPGVMKANFDRIENGMTVDEVEGLFGGPTWSCRIRGNLDMAPVTSVWTGHDGATADISFFKGVVSEKRWTKSTETISDKLRRWLSLPRK